MKEHVVVRSGNDKTTNKRKQITLRLPDEVYKALMVVSKRIGVSIHSLVLVSLDEYLNTLEPQ